VPWPPSGALGAAQRLLGGRINNQASAYELAGVTQGMSAAPLPEDQCNGR